MAAAPRSCTGPPQSHAASWRATSTPNRSQRASSRAASRCPTCPTWTCCGGPAPSSARPTSSPGTPRTPNCSSPPASGQTSTAATCGTPSPSTRDGDAVTARPPADLNANVGVRRVIAGLPGDCPGRQRSTVIVLLSSAGACGRMPARPPVTSAARRRAQPAEGRHRVDVAGRDDGRVERRPAARAAVLAEHDGRVYVVSRVGDDLRSGLGGGALVDGEREFGVRRGPAEDLGAVPAGHDGPGPVGGCGLDEVVVEPPGRRQVGLAASVAQDPGPFPAACALLVAVG